jgi:hypothetical protein
MKNYVIFNVKSGDIVHTHTEAALSGEPLPVSRDDLVRMYREWPGEKIDPQDLDVLEVDLDLLRRGLSNRKDLYVDVSKRIITERPQEKGS